MKIKPHLVLLKSYLLHPFATIRTQSEERPAKETLVILALVSLAGAAQFTIISIPMWLLLAMVIASLLAFFLFLQSMVTDFVAQFFKLRPQSLHLFYWFALSMAPHLFFIVKALLIKAGLSSFSWVGGGLSLLIWLLVVSLQVYTIETLYKTSRIKALFIYLAPLLTILAVLAAFVIVGVLISMIFLR